MTSRCRVIGNDHARLELYGPGEVVSGHEFYDYEAKYTPGLSETSTHAEVSDVERAVIHKLTRDVYRAIGAEGFARIDFLMAGERIVVSEINTIPGFTPISLFPTMPAEGGYSFTDVCLRIVELALERHAAATGDTPDDRPTSRDDPATPPAGAPPRADRDRRRGARSGRARPGGRARSGGRRPA